ncbi:unannotated protein [freshwater metagenome]|jgi:hypothetical protein|uniref:Unannotated protein n=1 Tax=freshwater metagenome TaxID=449393 RepID=A0A6J7BNN8_9ZZZZ|nr:hypothetical protein [Actinomycetota bacterium]
MRGSLWCPVDRWVTLVGVRDQDQPPVDAVLPGRIGLLVRIPVQPGRRAGALDVLNRYVDDLDQEPGTEAFLVAIDPDDLDVVWLYEWFRDEAALEEHRNAPLFARLMAELPDLVAENPGIMRLDPVRLRMSSVVAAQSL